jgi:hypothetical protein
MAKEFIIPKQAPATKLRDLGISTPVLPSKEKALKIGTSIGAGKIKSALIKSTENPQDRIIATSKLGTPVYSRVVLKESIDTVVGNEQSGDGYIKFDTCIVKVSQAKNIIKTAVQGRNGTVKEYISDGDYQIQIEGQVLSQYAYKMPVEELNNLIKLLAEPNEIIIESDFIQLFGISYVVVESYDHDQVEGSRGRINFRINLISDVPVEIELGINNA